MCCAIDNIWYSFMDEFEDHWNELRDLRDSMEKQNYSQWNDDIIRRNKELEQEVDSLKYALVEERDRNAHLEEENSRPDLRGL